PPPGRSTLSRHDALPILPGQCVDELAVGGLVFRHMPEGRAEGEIAGHLHPGARIVQRGRSVRRACFACDGIRLVMPAFGSLTGTDRKSTRLNSSHVKISY